MNCEISVRRIMRAIVSIDSKAKAREAARLMVDKQIGSLVANRDGLPFGMVTERDLMKNILGMTTCTYHFNVSIGYFF